MDEMKEAIEQVKLGYAGLPNRAFDKALQTLITLAEKYLACSGVMPQKLVYDYERTEENTWVVDSCNEIIDDCTLALAKRIEWQYCPHCGCELK